MKDKGKRVKAKGKMPSKRKGATKEEVKLLNALTALSFKVNTMLRKLTTHHSPLT